VYLHKPRQYSLPHTSLYTGIVYSLLLLGYKPVQDVTVLNTVRNCNAVVPQYYIIILWDHRRICGPSLNETSLCGAYLYMSSDNPVGVVTSLLHGQPRHWGSIHCRCMDVSASSKSTLGSTSPLIHGDRVLNFGVKWPLGEDH
jgi:hypothetical protein